MPFIGGVPERLDVEVAADDVVGVVADRDRADGRDGLDARRLVRRGAEHRVVLGSATDAMSLTRTRPVWIPTRAVTATRCRDRRRLELLELSEQLEARGDGLTGVVLTCRGEAEEGHDAVAGVLREVTVMTR